MTVAEAEDEYLKAVASCGKPVLLSTGMCSINEVANAVRSITKYTRELVILHCTTDYPTAPENCNVRVLRTLAELFHFPIGFSDHSQ